MKQKQIAIYFFENRTKLNESILRKRTWYHEFLLDLTTETFKKQTNKEISLRCQTVKRYFETRSKRMTRIELK